MTFSHDRELLVEARRLKHDAELSGESRPARVRRSWPRMWTSPCCSGISVESTRNSVVLPLPLGPRSAKISPAATAQRQIADRHVLAVAMGQVGNVDGRRVRHVEANRRSRRIRPMRSIRAATYRY